MEPVYLSLLKDHKVSFKNISLCQMVNHLINKYPASEEAKSKQKQILVELWDPNKNIEHLYKHTKNTLERFGKMENLVRIAYHQNDVIHYVYMAVKKLQQVKGM